jgi:uncharacterized membrane protein
MENVLDESISEQGSSLTPTILNHLSETRKWALFFAVLGIIGTAIILFAAAAFLVADSFKDTGAALPFSAVWLSLGYLLIGVFYIVPVIYLIKFANQSKEAVHNNSTESFEEALKYLKLLFRYTGILTISGIVLYIILIAGIAINAAS